MYFAAVSDLPANIRVKKTKIKGKGASNISCVDLDLPALSVDGVPRHRCGNGGRYLKVKVFAHQGESSYRRIQFCAV